MSDHLGFGAICFCPVGALLYSSQSLGICVTYGGQTAFHITYKLTVAMQCVLEVLWAPKTWRILGDRDTGGMSEAAMRLFVDPCPHVHSLTVRSECINCHPLATSEHHAHTHTHTHTLKWLSKSPASSPRLSLSPSLFLTSASPLHLLPTQLSHTHAHDGHHTPPPSHVWARTQSS